MRAIVWADECVRACANVGERAGRQACVVDVQGGMVCERAGGRACVNAGERAGEDGESAGVREVCRRERG